MAFNSTHPETASTLTSHVGPTKQTSLNFLEKKHNARHFSLNYSNNKLKCGLIKKHRFD